MPILMNYQLLFVTNIAPHWNPH